LNPAPSKKKKEGGQRSSFWTAKEGIAVSMRGGTAAKKNNRKEACSEAILGGEGERSFKRTTQSPAVLLGPIIGCKERYHAVTERDENWLFLGERQGGNLQIVQ